MKKRNRQEYNFSLRVKNKLEKAGFTVLMMPQGKYRTQIIDMLVVKNGLVLPMEAKGKQSRYLKQHNAAQLEMQKKVFWRSGTVFCRVTQGTKPGQINLELFDPPTAAVWWHVVLHELVVPVKEALKIEKEVHPW
jgi:Holliday junction resolvase